MKIAAGLPIEIEQGTENEIVNIADEDIEFTLLEFK